MARLYATNVMKNIHLLQTDKASRVLYNSTLKSFCIQKEIDGMFINDGKVSGADFWGLEKALNNGFQPQNIYITSDEEIKEGDWMIRDNENPIKVTKDFFWDFGVRYYKIILTTDQDLIKDGVQAIDDEFLEWFVKNPSCEEIEVEKQFKDDLGFWVSYLELIQKESLGAVKFRHKIIIPKEEPKQETLEELAIQKRNELGLKGTIDGFVAGFEIAKERMYSDEEVSELVDMLQKCKEYFLLKTDLKSEERADAIGQVLEQFKKKIRYVHGINYI